ncbi:MAG: efflux RND transporter periplasmic adaptor subunit [Fuerstiella sp.]|nr:efflux RND transporter periplasmic adaptor subunit [Fuerstiella sp.]
MRFLRFLPASVLLGGLVLTAAGCSQNSAADRSGAAKPKPQTPVAVKTVAVAQEDIRRSTVQPATVHPFYAAAIQAKVHGYVKEVRVDIGDAVQAGDVLAIIDVPEMTRQRMTTLAQVDRQRAEEERAKAGIDLAKANVQAAEAMTAEAESNLQQVEASLAAAEAEFRRTDDLVKRGSMQPRILDEARKKRDSEAAGRAAVTSAIESAVANVNVAKFKLAAAQADLKFAAAETVIQQRQIEEIDELIRYATLTAPFNGLVTKRNVSPGDLVSERSSGAPLFVVSQIDKVRIHISVPENDAAYVDRGDSISLVFPSFPAEEAMTVTVTRSTGSLDPGTRTMLVEAEVANTDGRLLPGMFGQASITLSTKVASNMLPARAVRFDESGNAYVYVVSGEDVSVVPVTTGIDDGKTIEIVAGLEPGQTVIDAHLQRFKDGQKVRVLNHP